MKAWSGRFREEPDEAARAYGASVAEDEALLRHDVAGSIAHVHALEDADLVTTKQAATLREGLRDVHEALQTGEADLDEAHEDVHMNVEALLRQEVGAVADRLHTARSRNDQVALDLHLWAREAALDLADALLEVQEALHEAARAHTDAPVAAETHERPAQPVPLGSILAAHAARLGRDAKRALEAAAAADVSPLGAGAVAGTTLDVDPTVAADHLALDDVRWNPVDATTARGFATDALHAAAQAAAHLASLGDELARWSDPRIGVADLPEPHTTGSSLMPQKANPDVAELLRAGAHPAADAVSTHLHVVAGQPGGYHRDLQEAKRLLLERIPPTVEAARVAADLVAGTSFDPEAAEATLGPEALATDLAEALVQEGVPFRQAHRQVGELVREAEETGTPLPELAAEALEVDVAGLTPEASLEARGPHASPAALQEQLDVAEVRRVELADEVASRIQEHHDALDRLLAEPTGGDTP